MFYWKNPSPITYKKKLSEGIHKDKTCLFNILTIKLKISPLNIIIRNRN